MQTLSCKKMNEEFLHTIGLEPDLPMAQCFLMRSHDHINVQDANNLYDIIVMGREYLNRSIINKIDDRFTLTPVVRDPGIMRFFVINTFQN